MRVRAVRWAWTLMLVAGCGGGVAPSSSGDGSMSQVIDDAEPTDTPIDPTDRVAPDAPSVDASQGDAAGDASDASDGASDVSDAGDADDADDVVIPLDIVLPVDAATPVDVVVPVDVVTPRDVVTPMDVVTAVDVVVPRDVVTATDIVTPTDVQTPRDVVTATDVVTPADVQAPRDVVDVVTPTDVVRCTYEPVTLDAMGQPRNAAGQIRQCWPGELRCTCDRDNDCYANPGYVPVCDPAPRDAGADVRDVVTPDIVTAMDVQTPRDVVDVVTPTDVQTPRDVVDVVTPTDVVVPTDTGALTPDPVAYSGTFPVRTGRFTTTLTVAGEAREVILYVPTTRPANPPFIVMFHGTNGSGVVMFTDTDAQAVANANGVIIASPSSRYISHGDWDHRTEETYWETYPSVDPNVNPDLLLTRAILVEAQRRYSIDTNRMYALGHSNGAFFAQLVAAALNDRIAAFASSSGGNDRCTNTWSCSFQGVGTTCAALRARSGWCNCTGTEKPVTIPSSGRMPPGYLAHGTSDPLVSVQYTCELEALMLARGASVTTALRDDGHNLPSNFVSTVWPFFAAHPRR